MTETTSHKPTAIKSYSELDAAILDIHRNYEEHDDPYLEVTEDFFKALTKGHQTPYLTYGKPGVKIYRVGTKELCDEEDNLSADELRIKEIKRAQEQIQSKKTKLRK